LRNIHSNVTRRVSPGRLGACMHDRKGPKMNLFNPKEDWTCPTNHHWKLNQSEVAISGRLANQKPGKWTNQKRGDFQYVRVRTIYTVTESSLAFWVFWQTMTIFTCEKCDKQYTEKTNLTRHQKTHVDSSQTYCCGVCGKEFNRLDHRKTWSGPQLQLDLCSMWSVFQQTGQPSTPSCPARETRGQAETTDEEISSTWIRTRDEAATYRVTTNNDPPRKEPSCSRHGGSTWRSRVQSLI
jgi:hypothetical protein